MTGGKYEVNKIMLLPVTLTCFKLSSVAAEKKNCVEYSPGTENIMH
jgi:hypothetical protein